MELADIRLQNALLLRDHFARKWSAEGDRTPESRFAELIGITASFWSQIKSKKRHIGEKLARQIERKCKVALGSLDVGAAVARNTKMQPPPVECQTDDERHALQLFQFVYRMNPQIAKSRLLEVLQGELLKHDAAQATASRAAVIPLDRKRR